MRVAKALVRLHGCSIDSSAQSMFPDVVSSKISRPGPFVILLNRKLFEKISLLTFSLIGVLLRYVNEESSLEKVVY